MPCRWPQVVAGSAAGKHVMRPGSRLPYNRAHDGFSLIELMIAMTISALLMLALVQIAGAARSSFRLQEGLASVQQSGRFALESLADILQQAAFEPYPWLATGIAVGVTEGSIDGLSASSDRLAVRSWSERNCFGNLNPVQDTAGKAVFYLKESVLELNSSNNLAHTCRYGTSADTLVLQINRQGLVEDVESFQALYALDLDLDGHPDRWTTAAGWPPNSQLRGLQLGLLIRSPDAAVEPVARIFNVLEQIVSAPADGRLRRVFTYSQAFPGRAH